MFLGARDSEPDDFNTSVAVMTFQVSLSTSPKRLFITITLGCLGSRSQTTRERQEGALFSIVSFQTRLTGVQIIALHVEMRDMMAVLVQ